MKCEWQNLTGTPKTRLVSHRISRLEHEGVLKRGMPLCDVSTGSEAAAQIGPHRFIWDEKVLNYVNHSCNPNSRLDIRRLCLIAIRSISAGEEITCDYTKTEKRPLLFHCNCPEQQHKITKTEVRNAMKRRLEPSKSQQNCFR